MTGKPVPEAHVAIVGMACRFPGASTVDEYWKVLSAGMSMHRHVPSARFSADNRWRSGSTNSTFWGNFLDDPGVFDHHFFKISPREAASMDPQQRLALEVAYEAVEAAAYFDQSPKLRSVGVYLGLGSVDYQFNVASHPSTAFSALGTLRAFVSGRISHHFGWTGPSITYDTACSSSAVAIHSACKAILSGECSAALAGGVNVITSPAQYEDLTKSGFLSVTGPCRPFDIEADGYCRGEGAGMLFLKQLSAAIADNDPVLGVIASSAVNQSDNSTPIICPSQSSQMDLYGTVLKKAGLDPFQIDGLEAHGTGTQVGDPVEFESIRQVFGGERRNKLYIGSVKANIGHTEAASGVAGAIKAVLMIQHASVPKQINFTKLNRNITSISSLQLEIPQHTQSWYGNSVFVNNYGAAGSNAAFIVSKLQPPRLSEQASPVDEAPVRKWPIIIAAHSETSLHSYCVALHQSLTDGVLSSLVGADLSDLGFAMAHRANQALPISLYTTVASLPELKVTLMDHTPQLRNASLLDEQATTKPIVLCFGGQSSRKAGLHQDVYRNCAILRKHLDACGSVCSSLGVLDFYPQIFTNNVIEDVVLLHCMLFSVQYACAKAWMECGLQVSRLIGHSLGQLTAMCVSNALSLQEALRFIVTRARLIESVWGPEKGMMLSIECESEQARDLVASTSGHDSAHCLDIACYNSPTASVFAGSTAAIEALEGAIATGQVSKSPREIKHRRLDVTHGFHSALVDPILPALARLACELTYREPLIPIETCTSDGNWTTDAAEIVRHSREPVYFSQAVNRIAARGPCTWIEAGSDSGIIALVRNALPRSLRHEDTFQSISLTSANSMSSLAEITVSLLRSGIKLQFWPYHRIQRQQYHRIYLPPYQFDKTHHWLPLREGPGTQCVSTKDTEQRVMLAMISFIRPQNDNRSLADFKIDFQSPQYKTYIEGHKVNGYRCCPASVYLHLVARALVHLAGEKFSRPTAMEECCVQDIVLTSPLGYDDKRMINLELESCDDTPHRWCFQVVSRSIENPSKVESHATGLTCLKTDVDWTIKERKPSKILQDHDIKANIEGSFIYNIFSRVTEYAKCFRGVRSVSSRASGVLGQVLLPESQESRSVHSTYDPLLIDNFLQVAGLYVNCLRPNPSEKVYVCSRIGQFCVENDPGIQGAAPWDVIVHIDHEGDKVVVCDISARASSNPRASFSILGVRFSGISRESLTKTLAGQFLGCKDTPQSPSIKAVPDPHSENHASTMGVAQAPAKTDSRQQCDEGILSRLQHCLSEITGQATSDMHEGSQLEDIGVDSLTTIEVLDEIEKIFGVNIPVNEFEKMRDLASIALRIQSTTHKKAEDVQLEHPWPAPLHQSMPYQEAVATSCYKGHKEVTHHSYTATSASEAIPSVTYLSDLFLATQAEFDHHFQESGLGGFTCSVLPRLQNVVVSFIIEAFERLGCSVYGATVDDWETEAILPRYANVTAQFRRILEKAHAIETSKSKLVRFTTREERAACIRTLNELAVDFPQHRLEFRLLEAVGLRLADCLSGKEDPLHLLFGEKLNRELLTNTYTTAPIFSIGTRLLSTLLSKLVTMRHHSEPLRLLEIGAGLGGTTKSIINLLEEKGCPFLYTFTDISSHLVASAKKEFGGHSNLQFMVLDVEKCPEAAMFQSQDIIISTNTVHATKSLSESCINIRSMLTKNGILCLIELTRPLEWYDLIFGLLDGWWRFGDGRTHAIADVQFWEKSLRKAGFDNVYWTNHDHDDGDLTRLIVASASTTIVEGPASPPRPAKVIMETVLFKQVEGIPLYADIYYPQNQTVSSKLPVALLVHGGGHVMLSRKDVRPAQTQHLLDNGIIPISIDHRLCPEVDLIEGPCINSRFIK